MSSSSERNNDWILNLPLLEFIHRFPVNTRFDNCLKRYCSESPPPYQTIGEYNDAGDEGVKILMNIPDMGKTLVLAFIVRPFGNLVALRRDALDKLQKSKPLSIELKAFAKSVLSGHVAQQAYLDLDPYSRKLLMKLLKPHGLNLNGKEQDWEKWMAAQHQTIQASFLGHGKTNP